MLSRGLYGCGHKTPGSMLDKLREKFVAKRFGKSCFNIERSFFNIERKIFVSPTVGVDTKERTALL